MQEGNPGPLDETGGITPPTKTEQRDTPSDRQPAESLSIAPAKRRLKLPGLPVLTLALATVSIVVSLTGVWQTRRSIETGNRAWVGFQQLSNYLPVELSDFTFTPSLILTLKYVIENFGAGVAVKTMSNVEILTAENLSSDMASHVCDAAVQFPFPVGALGSTAERSSTKQSGAVLFPHQTFRRIQELAFGKSTAKCNRAFILGCVTYIDQFKAPHWTRFCVDVGDGSNPLTERSPRKLCPFYNDTDETARALWLHKE